MQINPTGEGDSAKGVSQRPAARHAEEVDRGAEVPHCENTTAAATTKTTATETAATTAAGGRRAGREVRQPLQGAGHLQLDPPVAQAQPHPGDRHDPGPLRHGALQAAGLATAAATTTSADTTAMSADATTASACPAGCPAQDLQRAQRAQLLPAQVQRAVR